MLLFYMALDMVDKPSERELIEKIFLDYSKYVEYIVNKTYPDLKSEAEDIVQSVFITVIERRNLFIHANEKIIKSLLYRFTRSECVDIIRKRSKGRQWFIDQLVIDEGVNGDGIDYSKKYVKNECLQKVQKIIKALPYPAEEVIILKYVFDMKNKEIAEELGLTLTNVSTVLSRSLKIIKKELEGDYDER